MTMSELLSCPFCGGEADPEGWMNGDGECGPECESCGATASSVIVWNRRAELAALKVGKGDAVAWRDHSVNYAKGEKCPATIETLHAAWDRDQELLLDQRSEISRLKEKINQLRQKRTTRPTATIQDEANRRPQTCNGRSWCKEGAEPCHYTAPPVSADAVSVPVELLERVCVDRCYPAGHTMSIRAIDELRALLAQSQE